MRGRMLLLVAGLLFWAGTGRAGRVGEEPGNSASATSGLPLPPPTFAVLPDTSRPVLRPDSVVAPAAPALVPDADDQPTRKTSLRIVVAIAFLTVTTLLLYNVRSR